MIAGLTPATGNPSALFRSVRLVAGRELHEGLRSRAFLTTFAITLILLVGALVFPFLMGGDSGLTLGVMDVPQGVRDDVQAGAAAQELELAIVEVADVAAGEAALVDGDVDAVLVGDTELVVEQQANPTLRVIIAEATGRAALLDRLDALGIDEQAAADLLAAPAGVPVRPLEAPDDERAILFAVGGTILLLMGVTFFASSVLTGVVEEKSSRVVEVVLGAMRPWQLLAGKLLGIGTLAFGQVVILVMVAVGAMLATGTVDLPDTTAATVAAVIGWFVLGFAFYSVVYAAAGALVSRVEDAQSSAGPIGFLLFAAYLASFVVVLPDPDGTTSMILSQVPGFAPLAMPARVAFGAVSALEMVLAVVLTLVATLAAVRLAGRVYQRSILRTEQVRWREALRRSSA